MTKRTITLAAVGAALSALLLAGCNNTPPPTAAELGQQATQWAAQCIHVNSDECKSLLDTFCKGLSKFIDSHDGSASSSDFGGTWLPVSAMSTGCPGITLG